jgi:hypothetical protein
MAAFRDDLRALSDRQQALTQELAAKTRELSDASALLADARARAKLPVLDNIRVATPCSADWNKMTGDDRVRACADCTKNVYNLSDMTRDEAQALIVEKEGKLCIRYFQRSDGTILLKDCVIGIQRKRRRRIVAAGAAALLAGGGALAYKLTQHASEPRAIAGLMEIAPEPHLGQAIVMLPDVHDTGEQLEERKGDYAGPPVRDESAPPSRK